MATKASLQPRLLQEIPALEPGGRIQNWYRGLGQVVALAVKVTEVPADCGDGGTAFAAGGPQGDGVPDAAYDPAAACSPDSSMASNWAAGMAFSSLTTWLPAVVPHQSSVVPEMNQSDPLSARTRP